MKYELIITPTSIIVLGPKGFLLEVEREQWRGSLPTEVVNLLNLEIYGLIEEYV